MKTRRGFLAAMGLGAGAVGLGLPGTGQAHGWRRQRGYCAPANPCYAGDCYASCFYACAMFLQSSGGGVYTYSCCCIPGPGNVLISVSPNPLPDNCLFPNGCPNPVDHNCCFYRPMGYRDDCCTCSSGHNCPIFLVNSNLKYPATQTPAQGHFIDGIAKITWDALIAEMMRTLRTGSSLAVTYVKLVPPTGSGPDRFLALYDLYFTNSTSCNCCSGSSSHCVVHFGLEVCDVPPSTVLTSPAALLRSTVPSAQHHLQVLKNASDTFIYDVATRKDLPIP